MDVEGLLSPISQDRPAGAYLKLDRSVYRGLRNAFNSAQSTFRQLIETPEASVDPALQNANQDAWKTLREMTSDALQTQTKDLELTGWLISSQLFTSQPLLNLSASLTLLPEYVERFWDHLNPMLPEGKLSSENADEQQTEHVEFRLRPLQQLLGESNETTALYMPLQMVPLIDSITLADYLTAEKHGSLAELKTRAHRLFNPDVIDTVMALAESYHTLTRTDLLLQQKCQDANLASPSFRFIKHNIEELLKAIQYLAGDKFSPWPLDQEYGLIQSPTTEIQTAQRPSNARTDTPNTENSQSITSQTTPAPTPPTFNQSPITQRESAFVELRKVAEYFREFEPHSPISFLLERAIRWGQMSLPELMQEMLRNYPDAMNQLNQLSGMDNLDQVSIDTTRVSVTNAPTQQVQTNVDAVTTSVNGPDTDIQSSSEKQTQTEATNTHSDRGITDFEW